MGGGRQAHILLTGCCAECLFVTRQCVAQSVGLSVWLSSDSSLVRSAAVSGVAAFFEALFVGLVVRLRGNRCARWPVFLGFCTPLLPAGLWTLWTAAARELCVPTN